MTSTGQYPSSIRTSPTRPASPGVPMGMADPSERTGSPGPGRIITAVGDPLLRRLLAATLGDNGFLVTATADADTAHRALESFVPDIVVTERGFGADGPTRRTLAAEVLGRPPTLLVIITPASTAPTAVAARVRALRDGADEAIAIDTPTDEMSARCEALLRRIRAPHQRRRTPPAVIEFGSLRVDLGRRRLTTAEHEIAATRIEFALFEQLCRYPAEVRSRAQLIEAVWGPHWVGDTHLVDVHLSNLRRKVRRVLPEVVLLHTVRGVGFRLGDDLGRRIA